MIWRALNKRTKIKSKIPVSKICGWIDIGEAARIVVRIIVLVGTQRKCMGKPSAVNGLA